MKKKHIWQKAFSLSVAFHLIVILTVGAMAASFHQEIQRPQEHLINVNLADTPEEIAKAEEAKSPFNKIKNFLDSPAQTKEAESENTPKANTNNNDSSPNNVNPTPTTNTAPAATGEVSSPDGILPATNGGGGNDSESSSVGTGGGGSGEGNSGGSESGGGDGGASRESLGSIASRFSQAVDSNKEYPYAAKRLGQQGTVGLYVVLDSSGNLVSASVTSSVNNNLDNAALKAVRNACPFPHGYGSTVEISINVNFYMN